MKYCYTNVKDNFKKLYFFIPISLFIAITIVFFAREIKGVAYNDLQGNMFYVQILNRSMPLIKHVAFDTEDLAESKFSLKDKCLDILGMNWKDPIKIMAKEIHYFSMLKPEGRDGSISLKEVISSFNIGESSILKNSEEDLAKDAQVKSASSKAYNPNLKKQLNASKPEVLIYHTHTSESYITPDGNTDKDSFDENRNVCAVGDELARELEKNYGISVIHDKTVHNSTYTQSYSRSRETLTQYLNKYGDFKLIIDLHRDSVNSKKSVTANLNGEDVTKIMFVMTRKNPHFDKNNAIAENMLKTSKELFPGFSREIWYYDTGTRFFNQDLSNNAILIEVGAHVNKIEEAKGSAKYIARLVAEYLNGN
ncbi:stage II sporulation protein P [Clostridium sp. MSJ-4]|uniref:Stage II sporulation protein P n=1 Tax=Clostridium simiarum TaxID=2841506 RepID=A0ABS6EZG7_9CLOT|nr:stage II sporulation protein P [Clostridium simiarum]MBU5591039.1 stage II sporulation protein P [Clostridium simiarum]